MIRYVVSVSGIPLFVYEMRAAASIMSIKYRECLGHCKIRRWFPSSFSYLANRNTLRREFYEFVGWLLFSSGTRDIRPEGFVIRPCIPPQKKVLNIMVVVMKVTVGAKHLQTRQFRVGKHMAER
jgi:hypothetical protein